MTKTNWDYYLHPYRTLYAKELAKKGNSVFWINEPTKNPLKFLANLFLKKEESGVRVFTPFLITPSLLNLSELNSTLLYLQLFWLCGTKNSSNVILWSVYCSHYNVIKKYTKSFKIYWPGDFFDTQKERNIVKSYDFVMPLCEKSINEIKEFYSGKFLLSTTGCDWELFNSAYANLQSRELLKSNRKKRIGYVGNISAFRLDFELIAELGNRFKNFDFIFAGPIEKDDKTEEQIKRIESLPNINFIGEIQYQSVPDLIYTFDIGIIPYLLNSFNLGTNPNKFFEYSAMGIPSISTNIPSLRKFLPKIKIAHSLSEWIESFKCLTDISDSCKSELRKLAKFHSPKESLKRIEKVIS